MKLNKLINIIADLFDYNVTDEIDDNLACSMLSTISHYLDVKDSVKELELKYNIEFSSYAFTQDSLVILLEKSNINYARYSSDNETTFEIYVNSHLSIEVDFVDDVIVDYTFYNF